MATNNVDDKQVDDKDQQELEPAKKKKKKKKKPVKGAKGLETMYRNAYRAQLDMIALAATKANIMISLNGFIMSILLVTGNYAFTNAPIIILPLITFLLTSGISIYFALSAAYPLKPPTHTRVFCCFRDILKGKARFSDLKSYVSPEKNFKKSTSNILIFEHFAKLPKEEYLSYMNYLVENPQLTYEKMSDQLYWLGVMADKKFRLLRYAYAAFRWGIILSMLLFVSVKFMQYQEQNRSSRTNNLETTETVFQFRDIYEPSGVQQLGDGRLVIIEDEPENPLHLVSIDSSGKLVENRYLNKLVGQTLDVTLNDLESITTGADGYLYAMTSHKRNKKGRRKHERERFIRFKISGDKISDYSVVENLYDAIKDSEVLGKVDDSGKGGLYNLNIEAIGFDRQQRMMICLRNPQINGKSVILLLENTAAVFSDGAEPLINKKPILLDLSGGGFRAINYLERLHGYLITNESYRHEGEALRHSQILFWDGHPDHDPMPFELPSLLNVIDLEGLAPVTVNGTRRILLISDNGSVNAKVPANYMFIEYPQLKNNKPK
ncbi:MAG: hypothetical protein KAH22_06520 [Thiotrichaceae bacterium]|nr:hypothetical protein [Thiotrichaceae bacterium]